MRTMMMVLLLAGLCACSSCHSGGNTATTPANAAALEQRINDIYAETFKQYDGADLAVADAAAAADSLFCSRDWKYWTARVEQADSALNAEGTIGFFEADYWIMGQDWQDLSVSDVRVVSMTDSTALAEFNLHNCGNVTAVRLEMVLEDGDWKIDNFIDVTNGMDWKAGIKEYLNEKKRS